eukprot:130321-Rhodomonas_salina.1
MALRQAALRKSEAAALVLPAHVLNTASIFSGGAAAFGYSPSICFFVVTTLYLAAVFRGNAAVFGGGASVFGGGADEAGGGWRRRAATSTAPSAAPSS